MCGPPASSKHDLGLDEFKFELSSKIATNECQWMEKQVIMPFDLYVTQMVSILNEMEKSCFHRDDDDVLRNGCGGEGEEKDETESKVWAMTSDVYTWFLLFTPNEIVKQKLHSK